jgi:hypothetical protein
VGFPNNDPPIDLSDCKFPLLDRALTVSDKIKKVAGQQGWMFVLNAVRKCEANGEGFDSLPPKVKELILEAETR